MEKFKEAYNGNLANGLGNIAARILTLAQTHLPGPVHIKPALYPKEFTESFDRFEIHHAMDYVWSRIQALDRAITESEPFRVVKTDAERGGELIAELVQELAAIDLLLEPLLPQTSKKIIEAVMANKKPEPLFPRKE